MREYGKKGELDSDEEKRSEDCSLDKHIWENMLQSEKQNNLCDNLRHVLLIASLNRPKPLTDQEEMTHAFYWTCPIQKEALQKYVFLYLFIFVFIFKEKYLNKINWLGVCVCGGGGI